MPRDPDARIEQILVAATAEFARAGLHGARIDAIARNAAMNKRLLYHYVGDKEALFDATVRRCIRQLAAGQADRGPEPWRLLCHAVAAGRAPDFGPMLERLAGISSGPEAARTLLGTILLEQLLPELAASIDQLPAFTGQEAAKPRVKMQPTMRGV